MPRKSSPLDFLHGLRSSTEERTEQAKLSRVETRREIHHEKESDAVQIKVSPCSLCPPHSLLFLSRSCTGPPVKQESDAGHSHSIMYIITILSSVTAVQAGVIFIIFFSVFIGIFSSSSSHGENPSS